MTTPEITTTTFSTAENPEFIQLLQNENLVDFERNASIENPTQIIYHNRNNLSREIYSFRNLNGNLSLNYQGLSINPLNNQEDQFSTELALYNLELSHSQIELSANRVFQELLSNSDVMPIRYIQTLLESSQRRSEREPRNHFDRGQGIYGLREGDLIRNPSEIELAQVRHESSGRFDLIENVLSERNRNIDLIQEQQIQINNLEPAYRASLSRPNSENNYQTIHRTIGRLRLLSSEDLIFIANNNARITRILN